MKLLLFARLTKPGFSCDMWLAMFDSDRDMQAKAIHVEHTIIGKVDDHTAMVVFDVFDPAMLAQIMADNAHRFDEAGFAHEVHVLSPLPH